MSVPKFNWIFHLNILFFLTLLISDGKSNVEVSRPRGVSLSRASLYDPARNFSCFDGTKVMPFDRVNDDYCDCLDGSDEPGTSACPTGTFYCMNAGHRPRILSSDRVNDGICDCCDGSDEYTGQSNCVNDCLEVGKAAREEEARLAEILKVGKQLRGDLSQEGQKMKNEKQQKLNELRKNKEEAEKIRAERQIIKEKTTAVEDEALKYYRELEEQQRQKEIEEQNKKLREEATEYFSKCDKNQDGYINVVEVQNQLIEINKNNEAAEEEAKHVLLEKDSINLEEFIEHWTVMKIYFLRDNNNAVTDPEPEAKDVQHEPSDGEVEEEEDDEDVDQDADLGETDSEDDRTAGSHKIPYDEETQRLVDEAHQARIKVSEADSDVRRIDEEIKQIEASLKKDFGAEEEFATLEGQCFEFEDHEYVYKLCPFDRAAQIPKSNNQETSLGKWARWDGPKNHPYGVMLYDNGQNCWNGPNRSTKVRVTCAVENKVTSVSEPNRCEYAFDFETPAACQETGSHSNEGDVHDEL